MSSDSPPDDAPDDPYLRAFLGICAELSAIRRELQRANEAATAPDGESFECRSCGATLAGPEAAERHAVQEHNAPADAWETLYA